MTSKTGSEVAQLGPILAPVPGLLTQSQGLLANVQTITRDAARAAPQLPALARNAAEGTGNLPVLLTQTQATMTELEKLLTQLRGLWLLGGGGGPKPSPARLPPRDVRP